VNTAIELFGPDDGSLGRRVRCDLDPKENNCLCIEAKPGIIDEFAWFVKADEDGECPENSEPVNTDY
jgi:hypothetical protein